MFLIEFAEGQFVNGELIDWIGIEENKINFTVQGDTDNNYCVNIDMQKAFVNHLQELTTIYATYKQHTPKPGVNHEHTKSN